MSVIGTSVAAGVAQTAQNAQQLARAQDNKKAAETRQAYRQAELFAHRVHSAEQTEETNAELPDRQAPGYENLYGPHPHTPNDPEPQAPPTEEAPLYQHLDVEA